MNKCFIKELMVESSNPNLPVLEIMTQFTLDAITASGNDAMTDEQQVALNHFFLQIGAINNDGIAAKLDFLYMPLICGQNTEKAFVDYIGEYTKTSEDYANPISFVGNGIVSSDLSSKKVLSRLGIDRTLQSYSAFVGTGDVTSNELVACLSCELPVSGSYMILARTAVSTTLKVIDSRNECQYYGKKFGTTVAGFSKTNDSYISRIVNNGELDNDYSVVAATTPAEIPSSYYFNVHMRNLPVKVLAFGAAMTTAECDTFATAIHELQMAFPDPVSNG